MSAIRRDPIYITSQVWRALRLLSKAQSSESKTITVDEMADNWLRDLIGEKFPQLLEHQRQIEKLEKDLIKSLQ